MQELAATTASTAPSTPLSMPSASPLTGTLLSSHAAEALEKVKAQLTLEGMRQRRRAEARGNAQEASSDLSKLAQQHTRRLARTPGTPVARERTPVERSLAREHMLQRLKQVEEFARGGQQGGSADPREELDSMCRPKSSSFTDQLHVRAPRQRFQSRPGSVSASWSQPLRVRTGDIGTAAMASRPTSRPGTINVWLNPSANQLPAQHPLADPQAPLPPHASHSSPLPSLHTADVQHARSRLHTPPASSSRAACAPAATPAAAANGGDCAAGLQQGMQASAGQAVADAAEAGTHNTHMQQQQYHQQQHHQQQQQPELASTGAFSATSFVPPRSSVPLVWQAPWHPPTTPLQAWQSLTPHPQPAKPGSRCSTAAAGAGAPGTPLVYSQRQQARRLEQFTPTRGMALSVFDELDEFGQGKLTISKLEDAAVRVGLRDHQIKKFYSMLDPQNRGYFTMRDWGNSNHIDKVMEFTRLWVQATRGMQGRMMDTREVKSAALALQIALNRLMMKTAGRSVAHGRLYGVFEFMDADRSGALTLQEIKDAFSALGINVTDQVLHEIMVKFDRDNDGKVDYREFIRGLFPVLSQGYRVHD